MLETVKEGIYVKRKKVRLGTGGTSKDTVSETLWFPFSEEDGFVELLLVTDNLDRVLNLSEKVSVGGFSDEYVMKENSIDVYQRLKSTLKT